MSPESFPSYVSSQSPVGITMQYFHELVMRYGSEDTIPLSEIDIGEYNRTAV